MDLDKDVSESNWNGNVYSIILRVVTYVYLFLLSFRTYSYNFAFLFRTDRTDRRIHGYIYHIGHSISRNKYYDNKKFPSQQLCLYVQLLLNELSQKMMVAQVSKLIQCTSKPEQGKGLLAQFIQKLYIYEHNSYKWGGNFFLILVVDE